jgi:hypothetical protein
MTDNKLAGEAIGLMSHGLDVFTLDQEDMVKFNTSTNESEDLLL